MAIFVGRGSGMRWEEISVEIEERAKEIFGKVEEKYPADMDFEVYIENLPDLYYVRIQAYTCPVGTRVDISKEFLQMPDELLVPLIERVIDCAGTGDRYTTPMPVAKWIYDNMWRTVVRPVTPGNIPCYSKMSPQAKEAFRMLRGSGLLDDLPEGTVFRHGPIAGADVARRIIHISAEMLTSTRDPMDIALEVYRTCILGLVVKGALVNGMNVGSDVLADEMMTYAKDVVGEAPAIGE